MGRVWVVTSFTQFDPQHSWLIYMRPLTNSWKVLEFQSINVKTLKALVSMPSNRCVVVGCSNISDRNSRISLHKGSRLRQMDEICAFTSSKVQPTGRFVVCLKHFEDQRFVKSIHQNGTPIAAGILSNNLGRLLSLRSMTGCHEALLW
jgi:hypothetical protein